MAGRTENPVTIGATDNESASALPTYLLDYIATHGEEVIPVMSTYYDALLANLDASDDRTIRYAREILASWMDSGTPAERFALRGHKIHSDQLIELADAGALVLANELVHNAQPLRIQVLLHDERVRTKPLTTVQEIYTMFGAAGIYDNRPLGPHTLLSPQFGLSVRFESTTPEGYMSPRETVTISAIRRTPQRRGGKTTQPSGNK